MIFFISFMCIADVSKGFAAVLRRDCEWVKRPAVYSVCERKVIRVIVTSTMIKLGQCNPPSLHPSIPPSTTTGKAERGKKKKKKTEMRIPSPDSVRGCKHGDAGARFASSTGRYLCCVGTWRRPQIISDVPPSLLPPEVCAALTVVTL